MRATRRDFLRTSLAAGLAWSCPCLSIGTVHAAQAGSPNDTIQIAIVGLGGLDIVGGVGGRGRQLINSLRRLEGVRVAALCDVDRAILEHETRLFQDRGEKVAAYTNLREALADKNVDAVAVATPNHWHALATVWACQAGKDVYVEKPFSYDLWEGRQMVAAARHYSRMVQVGTQSRSSQVLREALEFLHNGGLGPVRSAHALVYRPRQGIGRVDAPVPVPDTIDYDLWCGPAPKTPLMRKQLHYEWHWFWGMGNGELGNNGVHVIDICRWALRQSQPPRALSIGGRFAFDDAAQTPNTQIAFFDYQPAPLICEVRNVRSPQGEDAPTRFRSRGGGIVIDCEGGYLAGDSSQITVFDREGRPTREFKNTGRAADVELAHLGSFLRAMRSRKSSDLTAEALEGHLSTTCCHMGNLSYRLGQQRRPELIREIVQSNPQLADAFARCSAHLRAHGVDLERTPPVLGPWLTLDAARDQFVGEFAEQANALARRREARPPFVVPEVRA